MTTDRDARPAHLSRSGGGPGTPATNWAGNLHHTLGCTDAAVCFRKELGSGCSGGTQVGLPTSCQSTRSLGWLLGTLPAGPLHDRRDLPASILSLSLARRSRGSSANFGEGRGHAPHEGPRRALTGALDPLRYGLGASAIGWMPWSMPGPCWPDLGCLGSVGSHAGAGRAGAAPAGAWPLPASRHRGPDGLQGSTSNVATSSQERASGAPLGASPTLPFWVAGVRALSGIT